MKKVINITLGSIVFAIDEDAYGALASYLGQIKSNLKNGDDTKEIIDDVEFGEGEEVDSAPQQTAAPKESAAEPKKRLYRDPDNAIVAGIASGIANYFDIDPVIVRLIFVISIFFNGLGLLAYIILWLVVPVAQTTADKYAMRGERVTLRDISERVKKNLDDIEQFD